MKKNNDNNNSISLNFDIFIYIKLYNEFIFI